MARNTIESEIRTSKMADVSRFVKKIIKKIKKLQMQLDGVDLWRYGRNPNNGI